ncbi:MAG TPA: hypothetical protein VK120_07100 [Sporosarcina sp.]|nr:hypothetical protein [Sporosarcina sp.]
MRKLFNMNTSIVMDGFQKIMMTGKYELVHFNEKELIVNQEHYEVHCEAMDLIIETLSEEQLVLSFSSMKKLLIIEKAENLDET